jgi:hypothetical protein
LRFEFLPWKLLRRTEASTGAFGAATPIAPNYSSAHLNVSVLRILAGAISLPALKTPDRIGL